MQSVLWEMLILVVNMKTETSINLERTTREKIIHLIIYDIVCDKSAIYREYSDFLYRPTLSLAESGGR